MGFEMLVEVTHVCECLSAILDWAYVRFDLEVNDFMVSL